ncbi:leucine-rich repeat domain-containing protein [Marinoscillum pacificum]|uniref:leucine-rich repeat domain-containing protein n=1 Tax=Marinoscillum pacificum TaxID=392723 RepID=UPI0021575262|nr:leucine-rich repeat domain-containing protein [Marinoscillum pacificum]
MKALRFLIIWLFVLPIGLSAQMVNDGAQISVTSATTVSGIPELSNNGSLTNEGKLQLLGSFTNTATYNGSGEVELLGESQSLDINDTISVLTLSGSGAHSLGSSLLITEEIVFNDSKLETNEVLALGDAVTVTNASSSAYLIGSLKIFGESDQQYPIGTETAYLPVSLSSISGSDLAVSITPNSADPSGVAGYGLLSVANDKFWQLSHTGIFTQGTLTLPVSNESLVTSLDDLRIGISESSNTYSGLEVASVSGDLQSGQISSAISTSGSFTLGRYFDESLREADSLALVNIYEATAGDGWTDNSGWKSAAIDEWFGVTVTNKRPVSLELGSNNLIGAIAGFDISLDSLDTIDLSDNFLTSIEAMNALPSVSSLDISNNHLQFGDIESHLGVTNFSYLPQGEVLDSILAFQEITTLFEADRTLSGSANNYQWYKIRNGTTSELATTDPVHSLEVSSFADEGYYYASVSSDVVTDLTLTTRPVRLKVSSIERDSLALVAFYIETNGTSWTDDSGWLSESLENWNGVSIGDFRVTELNLTENNVTGKIPEELLDVRQMTAINLSDNRISSIPDFHDLSNLTTLDVSGNNLDFGDLEQVSDISFITYSPQRQIGSVMVDTLAIGSTVEFVQSVGGTNNSYQWNFEGLEDSTVIAGATSDNYEVVALNYYNMGSYSLEVTNSLVPNLTLTSFPKTVWASSSVRLNAQNQSGTSVNEGVAYLFKIIEGQPYDSLPSVEGSTEGYLFEDVVLGNYLALVEEDLDLYLPTYYSSTDLWSEATPIELREDFTETITMVSQPGVGPAGPGEVLGTVESEFADETSSGRINARRKVKRAGCSVRRFVPKGRNDQEDGEFQLVAYVQSDDEGRFEFDDLIAGLYRFNVEYPGIPMDEDSYVEFEVGEAGSENDRIVLEILITEDAVTVVKVEELGFFKKQFEGLKVYPNPADEMLSLAYDRLNSESVEVQLMDLSGHVLMTKEVSQSVNEAIDFDVSDLVNGIYLLHFKDYSGQNRSKLSYKVIINHK